MKISLKILLLMCISFYASGVVFSQELDKTYSRKILLKVFKNQKFGLIDFNLNQILEFEYDSINICRSNLILAKKNNKFGLFSNNGRILMDLKYANIAICYNSIIAEYNGKFALFDIKGKQLTDFKYSEISALQNNLFLFELDNKCALFDNKGKQLSKFKYSNLILLKQFILAKKNNKFLLLSKEGESINSKSFDSFYKINDSIFILGSNNKQFLYSSQKNKFPIAYDSIYVKTKLIFLILGQETSLIDLYDGGKKYSNIKNDYYFSYANFRIYSIADRLKIFDINLKKAKYLESDSLSVLSNLSNYYNPRAGVLERLIKSNRDVFFLSYKNKKQGVVNLNFELIVPHNYDKIEFKDSLFYVFYNGKKGLYDIKGNQLLPANFENFEKKKNCLIVENNDKKGVFFGKKITIPLKYTSVKQISDIFFEVSDENGLKLVDINNKIISQEYDSYKDEGNAFIIKKNKKYGLLSKKGKLIFKPQFDKIKQLNSTHFKVEKNKKQGIVNIKRQILAKLEYSSIKKTEIPNVFEISGFRERIRKKKIYLKTGYINTFGEILLDTLYFSYKIKPDLKTGTILVNLKKGVLFISIEENGKLIDKVVYENYISLNKIGKGNVWRRGGKHYKNKYGLISQSGYRIISYRYDNVKDSLFPNKNITRTQQVRIEQGADGRNRIYYGVVNKKRGKIIVNPIYKAIVFNDFKYAVFARAYASRRVHLLNKNGRIFKKEYSFVGDFKTGYARFCKGGGLNVKRFDSFIKSVPYDAVPANEHDKVYKTFYKGKWGVLDTLGRVVIPADYNYLSECFENKFIAKQKNKWGIISTEDSIILDFKYPKISFFYADRLKTKWANIPYYKISRKGKYGVIDSVGNIIVPMEFSNVTYIKTDNDFAFLTHKKFKDTVYGFIDTLANIIVQPKFVEVGRFSEGRVKVRIGRKSWNFADEKGNLLSEKKYRYVRDFKNGYAAVFDRKKRKWTFIDKNGNEITSPKYDNVNDFNEGLAFTQRTYFKKRFLRSSKKKYENAYINTKGNAVLIKEYPAITSFKNGLAISVKNNKYGIIDTLGKYIVKPKFQEIERNVINGYYIALKYEKVKKDKKKPKGYAVISEQKGKVLLFDINAKEISLESNKDKLYGFDSELLSYGGIKIKEIEYSPKKEREVKTTYTVKLSPFFENKASFNVTEKLGLYNSKGNKIADTKHKEINFLWDNTFQLIKIGEIKYVKL